ncbi:MAG: ThuA domain-containing protein [Kiritimatiellia bacterium]|jgi:type 1 glutamine amidotransferase|nr:ThuA domain-containing protein [Kiritimatiellia bacterium]
MKNLIQTALAALLLTPTVEAQILKPVPPADVQILREAIGTRMTAQPSKPRTVLVFWRCEGYTHTEAIEYGNQAFEIAAQQTQAFRVEFSSDYRALTDTNKLLRYDAVVLNNTTHLKAKDHPALVPNLTAFVKSGRGLCVIHAGADNFYDSPEAAEMVGGLFDGHPWGGGGTWAFKLDEPGHPLNRAFGGQGFKAGDEIYQQKSPPYDRSKLRVLVSLDLADAKTAAAKNQKRADKDFAVSWVRPYGAGRVFYTSFAHDRRAYLNKATLGHILDGLQYTLGDLKADDAANTKTR